tara:strand:- start:230 stop:895 length:666 start_codon:yes stop_codon:yes gene_type:complete
MAVVIGNKTQANPTPGANNSQVSHTQNTGSDGLLIASFIMANNRNFTSATYGGQAMTQVFARNLSGSSQRLILYVLENPPTGSNTLRINFNNAVWNPISIYACSFTGAQAGGNTINLAGSATPKTSTISVSDGSVVYSFGLSTNVITSIEIPQGNARPAEFTHNTNRQVRGGLSNGTLAAGTYTIEHNCATGGITMSTYEIQEKSGGGGGGATTNDFFLVM